MNTDKILDKLSLISHQIEKYEGKFELLEKKYDGKFELIKDKFELLEKKFIEHDKRFDEIDGRFDILATKMLEHDDRLESLETIIKRIPTYEFFDDIINRLDHITAEVEKLNLERLALHQPLKRVEEKIGI